jgi:hypothetical protein
VVLGGATVFALITRPACACSPSPPPSVAEGIVISIDSTGLTSVHGFSLRTADGATLEFRLGDLDNPTRFAPGHLAEHQASSSPIRVFFRFENAERVVYRLEDVVASPAPAAT